MAYSIAMAAHVSSLHSDLIHDSGTLSGGEVVLLMEVIESILSTPPSFYSGEAGGQELRDKVHAADQTILAIEKCHDIPVQSRKVLNALR